jgi:rod shape-determining protein MreC
MRRVKSSAMISSIVFALVSAVYLLLPYDPVSSTIQELIFGIDNKFHSNEQLEINETDNRIDDLSAENQRLADELNFKNSNEFEFMSAIVVGKNVQNYRSYIDINIGETLGVKEGQAVVSRGQLIGRIVKVFENRSRLITVEDPDFRAAAFIEGSEIEGLVRTVAGGTVIEQVPDKSAQKLSGNRVITSGLGGVYPPGLYIAELGNDISEQNAIFRQLTLNSVAHIASVQEVMVVMNER